MRFLDIMKDGNFVELGREVCKQTLIEFRKDPAR